MRQFKEYLEEEGLPSNEERIEFMLPVVKNLNGRKLNSIRIQQGKDFKRDEPKPVLDSLPEKLLGHPITLDWYPKIESQQGADMSPTDNATIKHEGKLEACHLAFMDIDAIWFELQRFKDERGWHNLTINQDSIVRLLSADAQWYRLFIPADSLELTHFDRVRQWQEIALALLKKYADRYYKYKKQEWESDFYEYYELPADDPNIVSEYQLMIDESQDMIVDKLNNLKMEIAQYTLKDWQFGSLQALAFSQHLYEPLLHFQNDFVDASPATLNEGEKTFIVDLRNFYNSNPSFFENRELYLLRNLSRGRGIGFFEAGNFYPDFLLWLLVDGKQYVSFVDPKGIRNLEGLNDPKIRFYRTIKDLEARLGDPNVILNSFIISNTPLQQVRWWTGSLPKEKFADWHVFFQKEDQATYIKRLFSSVLGPS